MRRYILSSLAVALLTTTLGSALAADKDGRAVIARAVEVLGGEERLARGAAVQTKMKGLVHDFGGGSITFQGDVWSQVGVGQKFSIKIELPGVGLPTVTQVVRDGKGWKEMNGEVSDMTEQELAESRHSSYLDGMPGLVHLLRDKAYTMTLEEETKIEGKPATPVLVRAKGKPDVTLFFDKESGLLVKQSYREKDAAAGKETLEEIYFSDYRLPDITAADEKRLKGAGVATDATGLVGFLKKQKPDSVDAERIKKLIQQLGDDDFDVREKATEEVVKLGATAVPFLKQATKDSDAERSRRAEECLKRIGTTTGGEPKGDLIVAAVRLVGYRKPEGATDVLLGMVPAAANDPELQAEVYAALAAVALKDGKPDAALKTALESKDDRLRAAAEAVVGEDGGKWKKQAGRRLFHGDVKVPMKALLFKDGKKYFEREIITQQYFNRFDEAIWAKPGAK